MKRKHIGLIIALGVLAVCGIYYLIEKNADNHARVIINGTSFAVHVADTDAERRQGLSGRKYIDIREGMLFMFDTPGKYEFWMQDMLLPIDIIWMDSNGQVVLIEQNVSPDSYPQTFGGSVRSHYVLEVAAGVAQELNIQVGNTVQFIL